MRRVTLPRTCLRRSIGLCSADACRARLPRETCPALRRSRSVRPFFVAKATAVEEGTLLNPTAPAVMTAEEIMKILPHRYPFLLVDRVTHLEEEKMIVGYKNVSMNDNFFTGHFPDRPIMPGVLQVEALAQLTGILMLKGMDASARQNFFFGGVDKCRFRRPVVPGDTLMMKVGLTKMNLRFGIVKAHGEAFVNGEPACDADLTLVVAKSGS